MDASLVIVVVLEWEELIMLQTRALGMVFAGLYMGCSAEEGYSLFMFSKHGYSLCPNGLDA